MPVNIVRPLSSGVCAQAHPGVMPLKDIRRGRSLGAINCLQRSAFSFPRPDPRISASISSAFTGPPSPLPGQIRQSGQMPVPAGRGGFQE